MHRLIWTSRGEEKSGLLELANGHFKQAQENFERALEASRERNPVDVQTVVLHYRVATAVLEQQQIQYAMGVLSRSPLQENSTHSENRISTHLL